VKRPPLLSLRTVAALLLASAVVLAGCGGASTSATPAGGSSGGLSDVTLKVGDQKGGLQALLKAAGEDSFPYKVEWAQFPAAQPLLEAAAAGAVDVASAGDAPIINALGAGADLKIIAASRSDKQSTSLIVAKDSPIHSLSDLKGRTIGTTKGSVGHFLLLGALKKAGLKPGDVTLANLLPADAKAGLENGSVDVWATWDPYTATTEQTGQGRVLLLGDGISSGLGFLAATGAAVGDPGRHGALADLVARAARARTWAWSHADDYSAVWAKETGLPPEVASAAFKRGRVSYVPVDDKVVADLQAVADTYAEQKIIPKPVDVATVFDRSFPPPPAA
jgi:sulfonate transport system substrate-binding protein